MTVKFMSPYSWSPASHQFSSLRVTNSVLYIFPVISLCTWKHMYVSFKLFQLVYACLNISVTYIYVCMLIFIKYKYKHAHVYVCNTVLHLAFFTRCLELFILLKGTWNSTLWVHDNLFYLSTTWTSLLTDIQVVFSL